MNGHTNSKDLLFVTIYQNLFLNKEKCKKN